MDILIVTLPETVKRVTKDFLESPEKSEGEKISVAALAVLAELAKDVAISERQDLMIGTSIEKFFRQSHSEIAKRANGQMVELDKSFSVLTSASYGKKNFHEVAKTLLLRQFKIVADSPKEEPKIIAYGVIRNLLSLILITKTEKEERTVMELLRKIAPNDDIWQEMLKMK